jgi:hypothetical protein
MGKKVPLQRTEELICMVIKKYKLKASFSAIGAFIFCIIFIINGFFILIL